MSTKRILEGHKVDVAQEPTTLVAATPIETDYFDLGKYGRALFQVIVEDLEQDESVTVTAQQATDSAGTGNDDVEDRDGDEIEVVIDAPADGTVLAHIVTLTMVGVGVGDVVTINGVVFEGIDGEDYDEQEFDADSGDAAAAISLAACINANFDDIEATRSGDDVIIEVVEAGETLILVEDATTGDIVPETTLATALIEVDAAQLDDGFSHVGLEVESTDTPDVTVVLIRGDARYTPAQRVAASN